MTLPLTRFEGLVYRAHHPGWAFEPESGEGASVRGGRFNQPGIQCLYTCLRFETAWLEAQQAFAFRTQPMTLCSYRVDCEGILDLTTEAHRAAAGVSLELLKSPWEILAADRKAVPTWELTDRLIADGCAGIIVPSFASCSTERDVNLVLWRWSRIKPHKITVVDDHDRLPKDRSSW